jgi:hypothetical protein
MLQLNIHLSRSRKSSCANAMFMSRFGRDIGLAAERFRRPGRRLVILINPLRR